MKSLLETISQVNLANPRSIQEAADSLGQNNLRVGSEVAVIDDPTYPYAGVKGTVTEVDETSGTVRVKMEGGTVVSLMTNQLIGL